MYRSGILLSFFAVFLQIAVFLQPLLPAQYQVSPVCETITRALLLDNNPHASHTVHAQHQMPTEQSFTDLHHDQHHQCQYCTVHANLVLPPELGIKEILHSIQIRLVFFKRQLLHIYFVLQRLFLIPQGRAPPVLA